MENKKKTLMITGVSGFIGTNFIEKYIRLIRYIKY